MNIRITLISLALLFGAACGGGGGGALPPGPGPGPGTGENEAARSLLEQCGVPALSDLADYLAVYVDIANGTAPGVGFGGFNPDPLTLDLTLDLDADMMPDATAMISFKTPTGDPTSPAWTIQQVSDLISNGVTELPALLATLDGIVLVMGASFPGPPMVDGVLEVLYTSGVADTVSGDVSVLNDPCQTQLSFVDASFTGLTASPPNATVTASVTDGVDLMTGDIVMNGTNTASASMSFNSGTPVDFLIDLTTGAVTLAP